MDKQEIVKFWLDSAQEDWEFATEVWKSGKRLYNALFFAQLSLEKTLKALHYFKKEDHPLMTHDLFLLAQKIDLDIDSEMEFRLKKISTFNISARYDDYKKSFRNMATKQFTDEWMKTTEDMCNLFKSFIKKP